MASPAFASVPRPSIYLQYLPSVRSLGTREGNKTITKAGVAVLRVATRWARGHGLVGERVLVKICPRSPLSG